MEKQDIVKKLTEMGGKRWEKNGMSRIYISSSIVFGLETNRYNTGHISNANVAGKSISNSEAKRIIDCKIWFDLNDGQFHTQNVDRLFSGTREIADDFFAQFK